MSQVATRRKIKLTEDRVKVEARFVERGSILAGTKQGHCESFQIQVVLAGEHDEAEIRELLQLAHAMCFTEDALTQPVTVEMDHMYNGTSLALDTD